jgi:non-heme chloroperoxidase
MAGDLAEERQQRGWLWFWLHALRVTFALWRTAVTEAPVRVLAITLAGCTLFATPSLAAAAAIYLFPPLFVSALNWMPLSFLWWAGALGTGAALVSVAPKRGMAACAILAVAVTLLLAFASRVYPQQVTPASAQQDEWRDPSPHKATLVSVEDDVRLEVLDWGGSGSPLLLLAGLSDTAHVFDDVAPALARRHRVVGVTRRGHPGSSAPATGYGFIRLAEDVVRVMDAVGLQNPVVVGHSFAGEELHVLGARHADRIAGLVYVDAAFDRSDKLDAHEAAAKALPGPPGPAPPDLASFTTLRAFLTRTQGSPGPEGRLRARYVANPDGSVRRRWTPEPHVMKAFSSEMQGAYKTYSPERIRVPALAIYAAPNSPGELMRPWYNAQDAGIRERVEKLYPLERENVARHAKWFAGFAERGRVVQVSGGHDLFVSNPREVVDQIEAFVTSVAQQR